MPVMVVGGIVGIESASMLAALKLNVTLVDKRTSRWRFWTRKS